MRKRRCLALCLLTLLAASCKSPSSPDAPKKAANIILVSYTQDMKSYGSPVINGTVKNTGNTTGYNCGIDWSAYNAANTIIDTASGFPADLGDIPVGVSALFDAVFFKLTNWNQVSKLTYKIDWLDRTTGKRVNITGELKVR